MPIHRGLTVGAFMSRTLAKLVVQQVEPVNPRVHALSTATRMHGVHG